MSNELPIYLWKRLEGEEEHDRFGDRIVSGDIDGDGFDEWVIAASTATYMEGEGGVNPIPYYYMGKVYVYSHQLKLLHTLRGEDYGECFGASLALADVNGDGIPEIIVGSPRASHHSWVECGAISVYSGKTRALLRRWNGEEDYARLGSAIATLDWNGDGTPDIAASSHNIDPNGWDRNGKVTIYSGKDGSVLDRFTGTGREGLGLSLASGDVDGDGRDELVIGAPRYSHAGLTRNGKILIYNREKRILYESEGQRSFDELGHSLAVGDMDGDGTPDVIIGSPKANRDGARTGAIAVYSAVRQTMLFEKDGWFGLQELGMSVFPLIDHAAGKRMILAGSRAGAAYMLDMDGRVVHEFNGDEAAIFGYTVAASQKQEQPWIAIGAVAASNQRKFMSGSVYFMSIVPPAEYARTVPAAATAAPEPSGGAPDAKPKKILLATYWYLPHVGGVDVYVRTLKKELEQAGHQVDVFAHHPDMAHYYLVDGGKKIDKWQIKSVVYDKVLRFFQRYLPQVDPWIRYREIERYCFEVAVALLDLKQYDVIHTQDIISTRALSRVKPASTALVATIHGLLAKEHIIAGDIKSKESLAWKYVSDEEFYGCVSADATIVPTDWLVRELEQFGVPAETLATIPYGMDVQSFHNKMMLPSTGPVKMEGTFTISCPARLVHVKGHRTLLDALRLLLADPSWHCWLIGDGPLRKEIEQTIQEYELTERVTMLGDRNDVPQLLSQSDVMVLPSLQDNLPFSIMEAQLAGVPIVASDIGGIPEMIEHDRTGLLFEAGREDQLALQLERMMADPQLRERLAKRAGDWAIRQWSSVTQMERTLSQYDKALRKVRGS